jgi:DNA repair exonuclease SbcCD ATPase subunit
LVVPSCRAFVLLIFLSLLLLWFLDPPQEEIDSTKKDEEAAASGGEEVAENSDDGSDASSHFGLADKEKTSTKKKRKDKPPQSSGATPAQSKQDSSQADAKVKASVDQATKALASLKMVDANALWKNTFKDADVAARLKKVSQCETSLSQLLPTLAEGHQSKAEVETKIAELKSKVESIVPPQDAFNRLKAAKALLPELKDPEFQEDLCKVCDHLDNETLTDLLTGMGRKVSEAGSRHDISYHITLP